MAVFGFKTPQTPRLRSVALVASDGAFLGMLESYAVKAGFEKILPFQSNDHFASAPETPVVDVIVLDWDEERKDGTLSSLALFNRLKRMSQYAIAPIAVVSAHMAPEDFRLLREFPASTLLPKPLVFTKFQEDVKHLWAEHHWYRGNMDLMRELFSGIEENPREVAKELPRVVRSSPNPLPLLILIGRMLADKHRPADAEAVFRRVLLVEEANLTARNELGKILFRMGRHEEALETLKPCKRMSPHNMERLCLLGQLGLEKSDPVTARTHFKEALDIDSADPTARAGLKLADNVEEFFARANDAISVTRNFASLMNTIGITKVRAGAIDEGIEQYKAALPFLGDDVTKAKILFNLGLGTLRKKDFTGAMDWFQQSLEKGGDVFARSHKYVELVAAVLRKHQATKVSLEDAQEGAVQALTQSLVQGIEELGAIPSTSSSPNPGESTGEEDPLEREAAAQSDEELTPLRPTQSAV